MSRLIDKGYPDSKYVKKFSASIGYVDINAEWMGDYGDLLIGGGTYRDYLAEGHIDKSLELIGLPTLTYLQENKKELGLKFIDRWEQRFDLPQWSISIAISREDYDRLYRHLIDVEPIHMTRNIWKYLSHDEKVPIYPDGQEGFYKVINEISIDEKDFQTDHRIEIKSDDVDGLFLKNKELDILWKEKDRRLVMDSDGTFYILSKGAYRYLTPIFDTSELDLR